MPGNTLRRPPGPPGPRRPRRLRGARRTLAALTALLPVAFALALAHPATANPTTHARTMRPSVPSMTTVTADPVRIMPLGDSITGSPGCWRALLWNQLQDTGFTATDFVGTLGPQGCSVPYDGDNEGHGGALATTTADQGQLAGWLAAVHPDIVVMHFGTNDVWSGRSTGTILAAFTTLVGQMRADNPAMRILVAQILPMAPDSCADCGRRVQDLNAAIPGWAAGLSTAQSPITVVDQWTGFDTATDTYDGVHPNDAGNVKIAARWYPALARYLTTGSPS